MRERLIGRRLVGLCILVATLVATAATSSSAAPRQTFSTAQSPFPDGSVNQGYVNFDYFYGPFSRRGPYPVNIGREGTNNFFTFDLRSSCAAAGATLRLVRGSEAGSGDQGDAEYTIHEVTTPAEDIYGSKTNYGSDIPFFYDLGDGPIFGGGSWPLDGSPSDVLSYPLNAAGVAAVNAARGRFFTLGGTGGGRYFIASNYFLYANTLFAGVSDPAELVITCAVPTTKEECNHGGWRNYPSFKNQGDCVSYVVKRGKNLPAASP